MKRILFKVLKICFVVFVVVVILILVLVKTRSVKRLEGRAIQYLPDPIVLLTDYGVTIDFDKNYNNYDSWHTSSYQNVSKEAFDKYIDVCVQNYDYRITSRTYSSCILDGDRRRMQLSLDDGNVMDVLITLRR